MHRAHEATITGYEFGPTSKWFTDSTDGPTPSSCLATASLDGKVRLWKVDVGFELVLELSMGPSVPAMATSFSPDGSLIAAASYRKVLIWNAEKGKVPIASWHARTEKWPTEEEMAETGEEHLLKWQIHGGRLVYGLGSQVSYHIWPEHYRTDEGNSSPSSTSSDDTRDLQRLS